MSDTGERCGELYGGASVTVVLDGPITCQRSPHPSDEDHRYEGPGFGMLWSSTRMVTWTSR